MNASLLAIDLFCGLDQPQIFLRANSAIKKLVARRAENPYHMSLAVGHEAPRTIPFEPGPMRYLNHSGLSARLASQRHIGIATLHPLQPNVSVWSSGVIFSLFLRIFAVKGFALRFCGRCGADLRAIALVAVRRLNVKMRTADTAISTVFRDVGLFAASATPCAALARKRAVFFIWPLSREFCRTINAEQFVHWMDVA